MPAPATLLARALDTEAASPGDDVSERILDAALDLAAGSGIRNLTVDDIAGRAGVGRMTVYSRFGDKGASNPQTFPVIPPGTTESASAARGERPRTS